MSPGVKTVGRSAPGGILKMRREKAANGMGLSGVRGLLAHRLLAGAGGAPADAEGKSQFEQREPRVLTVQRESSTPLAHCVWGLFFHFPEEWAWSNSVAVGGAWNAWQLRQSSFTPPVFRC